MSIGDVYQLKLKSTYLGEDMLNVFYYRQTAGAGAGGAAELSQGFQQTSSPLQEIAAMLLDDVFFRSIEVVNGMDNTDQDIDAGVIPSTGAIDSAAVVGAPSLLAIGFRSNRNGLGTRYSYKRFSGFPSYFLEDNNWTASAAPLLVATATALGNSVGSGGKLFEPVQVTGGFRFGVTPTASFAVTDWVVLDTPSTQVTRKQGRGS